MTEKQWDLVFIKGDKITWGSSKKFNHEITYEDGSKGTCKVYDIADIIINVKTGTFIKNRKGPIGSILPDSNRWEIYRLLGLTRVEENRK